MPLPDLAALKLELNITSSTNDVELTNKLSAAVSHVEKIIGPITVASVTETHRGVYSGLVLLRRRPVVALTGVSSRVGATTTALTLSDYELDAAVGVVRLATGSSFWGDYQITYTVGRSDVPADIREAVLIIASHLWATQRGASPSPLALQDPSADEVFVPGLGFAIPNRAVQLLAPYAGSALA